MLGVSHQSQAGSGHKTGEENRGDDPATRLLRHAESCPREGSHLVWSKQVEQDSPATIPVSVE